MDDYDDDFDNYNNADMPKNKKDDIKEHDLFSLTDNNGISLNLPNRRIGQQPLNNKTQTIPKQPEQYSINNNNNTEDIPEFLK